MFSFFALWHHAIKSQGKKGTGNSLKTLGEAAGESDKTVQRFIRLSYLSDALLELVDVNKLGVKQGVEISYLSDEYGMIVASLYTIYVLE